MAKGKGLVVLALLIGISGLGLGIYSLVFPQVQTGGIQKTWFIYDSWPHFTLPTSTVIPIDDLTINFTVNSGESVYFLFKTHGYLVSGSPSQLTINFVLDGISVNSPEYPDAIFSSYSVGTTSGSIILQMATDKISPGYHNITISIWGNLINSIDESTLLVQTYIP